MTSQVSVEISNMETPDGISPQKTPPDPSEGDDNQQSSLAWRCLEVAGYVVLIIVLVIAAIVVLPFVLMYLAGGWFFCGIVNQLQDPNDGPEKGDGGSKKNNKDFYFQKVRGELQKTAKRVRFAKIPLLLRSRMVIVCLAWFIVNLSVPVLRKKDILGSHLWKWTFLLALIFCGYHCFSYATRCALRLLRKKSSNFKKNWNKAEYYTKGLRRSMSLVLYSGAVLLTWVFYFRTRHGIRKNGDTKDILHIGTWTFVSLAVAAILWLLKNVLLLIWEADAVYNRFRLRILNTGSMCYFLRHIYDNIIERNKSTDEINDHDQASDTGDDHKKDDQAMDHQSHVQDDQKKDDHQESQSLAASTEGADNQTEKQKKQEKQETQEKAKNILLISNKDDTTTMYDIKKKAKYFIKLSKACSREDDGTSGVLAECQKIKPLDAEDPRTLDLKSKDLEELKLEESDAKRLLELLKEGHKPNDKVSYMHFEKSMVKAHKNCVELGHTLVDAIGVVQVLDRVITLVLGVIAIIAWLLLTDIASTKLLLFIVSPLFGATFIFGGTCKKIFEGIIFTFINHPFDVGDKCIIQKNELEVKRMNVLATTFTVIGTKEEALYPNSALASIPIINLKGEPDPNDQIELTLDPSYTKSMLDTLQDKIREFFKDDKGEKYNKDPILEIKDVGKRCIRMVIQFQHVISNNETTHSQCLEKKRRQRSKLLLELKQFTEDIGTGNSGKKVGRTATIS